MQEKIVILEEGNQPYPSCPQCGMFVSHKALNSRHMTTAFWRRKVERKRRHLAGEDARAGADKDFKADGIPLSQVTSFKFIRWFHRQKLAGSGRKPAEGKAEVGATDEGSGKRGCRWPDLGPDILGGGPVGNAVRFWDMDDDPTHRGSVGQIPPQGGSQTDGE